MEAGTLSALRSSRVLAVGTGVRIVLAPVIMALVLDGSVTAAAAVFCVAAATDWFDGRLARRWNVTTTLGSFLDTTADKLLVTRRADRARGGRPRVAVDRARSSSAASSHPRPARRGRRGRAAVETSMLGKWKTTVQFVARSRWRCCAPT